MRFETLLLVKECEPCVQSIDIAHRNMKPGRIYRNRGELEDSSLNRSPHSYMNNPEDERHRYRARDVFIIHMFSYVKYIWVICIVDVFRYKSNTDKQVMVLKFTDLDGDGIGVLR